MMREVKLSEDKSMVSFDVKSLFTNVTIDEALDLELINRDEGIAIPECWQPVLDHATMTSSIYATPCRATDDETIDAI